MNFEPNQILSKQLTPLGAYFGKQRSKSDRDGGSEKNIVRIENVAISWFFTDP